MVASPRTGSLLKSPDVTRAHQLLSPEGQPSQASQQPHRYPLCSGMPLPLPWAGPALPFFLSTLSAKNTLLPHQGPATMRTPVARSCRLPQP